MSLADMIFGAVFERYPKLKMGSIEHEIAWLPHFMERLDYNYMDRPRRDDWPRFKENMMPSDYLRRNVWVSFQEDALGVRDRDIIGVDILMWGSDYPHIESTFPKSQEILGEILADCNEEDKAKIAGGNVARLFNMD
jgi:predicted TIM-barrel fold metal-dependent hydrolase